MVMKQSAFVGGNSAPAGWLGVPNRGEQEGACRVGVREQEGLRQVVT